MKKAKILATLAVVATISAAAALMTGCGTSDVSTSTSTSTSQSTAPEHKHEFADIWSKNDTHHWRECKTGDGEKTDIAEHEFTWTVVKYPGSVAGKAEGVCEKDGTKKEVVLPALSSEDYDTAIKATGTQYILKSNKDIKFTVADPADLAVGENKIAAVAGETKAVYHLTAQDGSVTFESTTAGVTIVINSAAKESATIEGVGSATLECKGLSKGTPFSITITAEKATEVVLNVTYTEPYVHTEELKVGLNTIVFEEGDEGVESTYVAEKDGVLVISATHTVVQEPSAEGEEPTTSYVTDKNVSVSWIGVTNGEEHFHFTNPGEMTDANDMIIPVHKGDLVKLNVWVREGVKADGVEFYLNYAAQYETKATSTYKVKGMKGVDTITVAEDGVKVNGEAVPSGVYEYENEANNFAIEKRIYFVLNDIDYYALFGDVKDTAEETEAIAIYNASGSLVGTGIIGVITEDEAVIAPPANMTYVYTASETAAYIVSVEDMNRNAAYILDDGSYGSNTLIYSGKKGEEFSINIIFTSYYREDEYRISIKMFDGTAVTPSAGMGTTDNPYVINADTYYIQNIAGDSTYYKYTATKDSVLTLEATKGEKDEEGKLVLAGYVYFFESLDGYWPVAVVSDYDGDVSYVVSEGTTVYCQVNGAGSFLRITVADAGTEETPITISQSASSATVKAGKYYSYTNSNEYGTVTLTGIKYEVSSSDLCTALDKEGAYELAPGGKIVIKAEEAGSVNISFEEAEGTTNNPIAITEFGTFKAPNYNGVSADGYEQRNPVSYTYVIDGSVKTIQLSGKSEEDVVNVFSDDWSISAGIGDWNPTTAIIDLTKCAAGTVLTFSANANSEFTIKEIMIVNVTEDVTEYEYNEEAMFKFKAVTTCDYEITVNDGEPVVVSLAANEEYTITVTSETDQVSIVVKAKYFDLGETDMQFDFEEIFDWSTFKTVYQTTAKTINIKAEVTGDYTLDVGEGMVISGFKKNMDYTWITENSKVKITLSAGQIISLKINSDKKYTYTDDELWSEDFVEPAPIMAKISLTVEKSTALIIGDNTVTLPFDEDTWHFIGSFDFIAKDDGIYTLKAPADSSFTKYGDAKVTVNAFEPTFGGAANKEIEIELKAGQTFTFELNCGTYSDDDVIEVKVIIEKEGNASSVEDSGLEMGKNTLELFEVEDEEEPYYTMLTNIFGFVAQEDGVYTFTVGSDTMFYDYGTATVVKQGFDPTFGSAVTVISIELKKGEGFTFGVVYSGWFDAVLTIEKA